MSLNSTFRPIWEQNATYGSYAYECPPGYDCIVNELFPIISLMMLLQNSSAPFTASHSHSINCMNDPDFTGYYCNGIDMDVCDAGKYCPTAAVQLQCPEGYSCPNGLAEPIKCAPFSLCAAGTSKARWMLLMVLVVAVFSILSTLYYFYVIRRRYSNNGTVARKATVNGDKTSIAMDVLHVKPQGGTAGAQDERVASAPALQIRCENISVTVPSRNNLNETKTILQPLSCTFSSQHLTAVMGGSGAGKTTLISAILNQVPLASGSIRVNGRFEIAQLQNYIGYVAQANIMNSMCTVRDVLLHSARMRLPASMSDAEKVAVVDNALDVLGLTHIQHSIIGDEHARGISGGQKKRVSIGMELVSNPVVMICDEPTSGLDSSSASEVVQGLHKIASSGCLVICVIHSPRYEIFQQFDRIMLLGKGGKLVYYDDAKHAVPFFESLGYALPGFVNPADHFIDCMSAADFNQRWDAHMKREQSASSSAKHQVVIHLADDKKEQPAADADNSRAVQVKQVNVSDSNNSSASLKSLIPHHGQRVSWFKQFALLLYRCLLIEYRDAFYVGLDTALQFLPGIALGINGLDNEADFTPPLPVKVAMLCPAFIRDRCMNAPIFNTPVVYRTFFNTMIIGATATLFAAQSFGRFSLVWNKRDKPTGTSTSAYFAAKLVYDLMHIARITLVFLAFYFFLGAPRGTFGQWFGIVFGIEFAAFGLGYFVSILLPFNKAVTVSVVSGIVAAVTSGLVPRFKTVKSWGPLQVLWYLSYNYYGAEAMLAATTNTDYTSDRIADTMMADTSYDVTRYGFNLGMLFVMGVMWRIFAYLAIRFYKPKQL